MYIMYIHRLLYSKYSKLIISIVLGIGLATLFRRECKSGACVQVKGPKMKRIKDQIFEHNNSCYTFTPHSETCDKSKRQVDFA